MRGYTQFRPTIEEIEKTAKQILNNSADESDPNYATWLKPIVAVLKSCNYYYKRVPHAEKGDMDRIWYGLIVERDNKRSKLMLIGIAPVRVWAKDTDIRLEDFSEAISMYGSDADQFCETKEHERIYRKQQKALLKIFEPSELRDVGACCAE